VYKYGAAGLFPNSTYKASNYWFDVVFSTSAAMVETQSTGAQAAEPIGGAVLLLGPTQDATSTAAVDAVFVQWTPYGSPTGRHCLARS
jgi:hypothetical protein